MYVFSFPLLLWFFLAITLNDGHLFAGVKCPPSPSWISWIKSSGWTCTASIFTQYSWVCISLFAKKKNLQNKKWTYYVRILRENDFPLNSSPFFPHSTHVSVRLTRVSQHRTNLSRTIPPSSTLHQLANVGYGLLLSLYSIMVFRRRRWFPFLFSRFIIRNNVHSRNSAHWYSFFVL